MNSITVAFSTQDHPVPGVGIDWAARLFVLHATAVRMWFDEVRRDTADEDGYSKGCFVIADDEWVNPGGGYRSLTIPAESRDLEALAEIRRHAPQGDGTYGSEEAGQ